MTHRENRENEDVRTVHHDELIGKVQALAQLPDRGSAEHVTRAVLTTLAERVPGGLADHLAAQLPPALGSVVAADEDRVRSSTAGEGFDATVFAGGVAARAGTDEDHAVRESAAVLEVLDAAVAPELMERIARALPPDIRELLPVGRADDPDV
nr:DUF2267 domain-containing protein [Streptomyces minutiscleroticus]